MTPKTYMNDGASPQARAILAMLGEYELAYDEKYGEEDVRVNRWDNGREHGYSIIVGELFSQKTDRLLIIFCEGRNHDEIVIYQGEGRYFNPPSLAQGDLTDEIYSNQKVFNYGKIVEAAEYIADQIQEWYDA